MSKHKQMPLHKRNWDVLGAADDSDDMLDRFEKVYHPPRELREDRAPKGSRGRTKFHRPRDN